MTNYKLPLILSKKGNELLEIYKNMVAENEYENNFFNIKFYKPLIKKEFDKFGINSLLDYGCGRVNYLNKNFTENHQSAKDYFNLSKINLYEPSIGIDERVESDCVMAIDVLEHIFLYDLRNIIFDIYQYSKKLVILQVACYNANAKLPNGENAHTIVRPPLWWKGMIDNFSLEFKNISTLLICSTEFNKLLVYPSWSATSLLDQDRYVINV